MGLKPQSPFEIRKEKKLKRETRNLRVEIRLNFDEKDKIKELANKAGKSISTYMRQTALGYTIKEKPSKEFYSTTSKLNNFIMLLGEMERLLYHKDFIDERKLKDEIAEWKKFRKEIRESFL